MTALAPKASLAARIRALRTSSSSLRYGSGTVRMAIADHYRDGNFPGSRASRSHHRDAAVRSGMPLPGKRSGQSHNTIGERSVTVPGLRGKMGRLTQTHGSQCGDHRDGSEKRLFDPRGHGERLRKTDREHDPDAGQLS